MILQTPLLLVDLSEEGLGDAAAGEAMAARMSAAHGGLDRWRERAWVELDVEGEVVAGTARFFFGLGERVALTLRFDPCDQSPMTATIRDAERSIALPSADSTEGHAAITASVRHLFEMPFAMRSADVVRAMAPRGEVERVFMSWGTAEAQLQTDQYIMHLDAQGATTGFRSTVRLASPFMTSAVTYADRVERDGLWVPRRATVRSGAPDGAVAHDWTLTDMRLGPVRPAETRCGG